VKELEEKNKVLERKHAENIEIIQDKQIEIQRLKNEFAVNKKIYEEEKFLNYSLF
jgi:hypothetical protein